MELKKLLNIFAILVCSVLIVSLETKILRLFDELLFILKADITLFQVLLMLS